MHTDRHVVDLAIAAGETAVIVPGTRRTVCGTADVEEPQKQRNPAFLLMSSFHQMRINATQTSLLSEAVQFDGNDGTQAISTAAHQNKTPHSETWPPAVSRRRDHTRRRTSIAFPHLFLHNQKKCSVVPETVHLPPHVGHEGAPSGIIGAPLPSHPRPHSRRGISARPATARVILLCEIADGRSQASPSGKWTRQ